MAVKCVTASKLRIFLVVSASETEMLLLSVNKSGQISGATETSSLSVNIGSFVIEMCHCRFRLDLPLMMSHFENLNSMTQFSFKFLSTLVCPVVNRKVWGITNVFR
jgi:hypothetical protein